MSDCQAFRPVMVHLFPNAQIQNRFLQKKWTISSTDQHCDIEWLSFHRPEENTHKKKKPSVLPLLDLRVSHSYLQIDYKRYTICFLTLRIWEKISIEVF